MRKTLRRNGKYGHIIRTLSTFLFKLLTDRTIVITLEITGCLCSVSFDFALFMKGISSIDIQRCVYIAGWKEQMISSKTVRGIPGRR